MKKYIFFLMIAFLMLHFYLKNRVYSEDHNGRRVAITSLLMQEYLFCEDSSALKRKIAPTLSDAQLKRLSDSLSLPNIPIQITHTMMSYQYSLIGTTPAHVFAFQLPQPPLSVYLLNEWKQKELLNSLFKFNTDTYSRVFFLLENEKIIFPLSCEGWIIPKPKCSI